MLFFPILAKKYSITLLVPIHHNLDVFVSLSVIYKDYYYILGLNKNSTNEDIRKAYRKLSVKFHPDKNDGDAFFAERYNVQIKEKEKIFSNKNIQCKIEKTSANNSLQTLSAMSQKSHKK